LRDAGELLEENAMRVFSYAALALLLLGVATGPSYGQVKTDQKRYYETRSPTGEDLPKPDPWCELAEFGSRSLWACPVLGQEEGYSVGAHSDSANGSTHSGGGGSSGGMGGSDSMGGGG
jgi:uncharacterized membrane protein YgcG